MGTSEISFGPVAVRDFAKIKQDPATRDSSSQAGSSNAGAKEIVMVMWRSGNAENCRQAGMN